MPKSFQIVKHPQQPSSVRITHCLLTIVGLLSAVACGAERDRGQEAHDAAISPPSSASSGATGNLLPPVSSNDRATNDGPTGAVAEDASASPTSGPSTSMDGQEASFLCGSVACACSDGVDDDGDGAVDGMDQECTGPLDDDEGTFATGIPGDNRDPKWQDCFFDGNSGAGDDGCRYHTDCLTGDASNADCSLTQACIDFCQPLTPPGCDCFGCCDVPYAGTTIGIRLSDSCSLANLEDEAACPRCSPTTNCSNECGECELCLGKTTSDLPEWCGQTTPPENNDGGLPPDGPHSDGGPGSDSDGGLTPDTPGQPPTNTCDQNIPCLSNTDCATGDYCRLGCCVDYSPQVL